MTDRRFDLVIFDFDGTLASSAEGICACMGQAFAAFGIAPPSLAAVRTRIGLTLEDAIRQLTSNHGVDVDVAAVAQRYRELHVAVAAPATALFLGAADVLRLVKASGAGVVLVSQKARAGLSHLVTQFDIERCFDQVLSSDDVTVHKPDAALYRHYIAPRFPHVAVERVLVVGDTIIDLEFAVNIGAAGCWAEYGYGDARRCVAARPAYAISAITDLVTVCGLRPPA